MNNSFNDVMENLGKLLITEKQSEICSKVCGRENYIIRMYDDEVMFAGTKGEYMRKYGWIRVPLMQAYHYTVLRFTYKKDWLEALKQLME